MLRDLPEFQLGNQVPPGNDWDIRTVLLMLISGHYETHLEKAKGKVVRSSSTAWRVQPLQDPATEMVVVKEEEANSDVEPQVRRSNRKPQPRKQFEV